MVPTQEQLQAERTVRNQLFPGTKLDKFGQYTYDWLKDKEKIQTIDTLEGISDGLLYMESESTPAAQFQEAFDEKTKREPYGSFETMFQENLLDGDLEAQFANLQNAPIPALGAQTYQPNPF
jgi:hypothetical protein